jgi:hypothetical protein
VGGPSAVSTAGASVEKLFAAGVGDDADDELEESEPSLEDVDQQGQLLRARLQVTLDDLDKYLSLVQHYRKSRKYKAS